jgi:class 3 adenylate cyclase
MRTALLTLGGLALINILRLPATLVRASGVRWWPAEVAVASALVTTVLVCASLERPKARELIAYPVIAAAGVLVIGMTRLTTLWWLAAPGILSMINIGAAVIGPRAFLPSSVPVDDPAVETRVRGLCREAGIAVATVESPTKWPGAMNDAHGAIVGLRRSARVLIVREALHWSPPERDVLLAHEIGHLRRHLDVVHPIVVAVNYFAAAAVAVAMLRPPIVRLFGVHSLRAASAFPVIVLAATVSVTPLGMAFKWFRRANERQADLDALEFTRDPDAFASVVERETSRATTTRWAALWSEHPEPAERRALLAWWRTSRVVTFLFTDIEGSTEIVERIGDNRWFELLRDHNELLRARVSASGGHELEYAGDGFLFTFPDAGRALLCAQELQRELHRFNRDQPQPLRVRMGVHTGEVIRQGDGVFGREVHLAARIATQAAGEEIVTSERVRDLLAAAGRFVFSPRPPVSLKGLAGEHRVYTVAWDVRPL